ncbi:hypothetical protein [Candidatus Contubernalis alkaliaceticus]|uniref:hypothetical protein n=1 Tax=Candidatus Contubernalis alkaliaceticus TaxID=338645 RepID=UPI001F4C3162|nr:hypothetical protein [Candidatus Contubernalis alkalaceticus]UNC91234.1 hypothetical protein HUE98_03505 [Candidatus Contubernalis alkalaceticus]
MKKEEIIESLDKIQPTDEAKQRMLNNVLHLLEDRKRDNNMKFINKRSVVPALALVFVVVGALLINGLLFNNENNNYAADNRINESDQLLIHEIKDQFQIDNKHYIILSEAQKSEFSLPEIIDEQDIGSMITTITTSVDESLIGLDVYEYFPAKGEAVVAVKKDNEYVLFKFFVFESYIHNQDEDVRAYLELYGMNSSEDIAKILFIRYSEQSKIERRLDIINEITAGDEIEEFYRHYSVMKNASDKYFDRLFNYNDKNNEVQAPVSDKIEVPPDYLEDTLPENQADEGTVHYAEDTPAEIKSSDKSSTSDQETISGSTSIDGSMGSAAGALSDSVTIRIYNHNGLYHEAEYFPNINFISRHEVNDAFADFLNKLVGN